MSRACPSLTPRLGIATPGSIDCGTVIQYTRLSGVFVTSPAMIRRFQSNREAQLVSADDLAC